MDTASDTARCPLAKGRAENAPLVLTSAAAEEGEPCEDLHQTRQPGVERLQQVRGQDAPPIEHRAAIFKHAWRRLH